MPAYIVPIVGALFVGILGIAIGYFIRKKTAEDKLNYAEDLAKNIIIDAEREAENNKRDILFQAKEEIHKLRDTVQQENDARKSELQRYEDRLLSKEDLLQSKSATLEKKESQIFEQQERIKEKENSVDELIEQKTEEIQRISGLTREEAKQLLLNQLESDLTQESAMKIREYERQVKDESKKIAQDVIAHSIQRIAADEVAETTVSVVDLPNEEMKGRIIGREGRNIRAIEALTGVDLIIDDTPEAVVISSFNPIRREIARVALEKLILDGRIHPTRIEEAVEKARQEVDEVIKESGEEAAFEAGVHGLHPELVKYLGRLKFRTSFGQNCLRHSLEVSKIAGYLAEELGLDSKLARRAGLLHDLGKSIDHEVEGPHVELGVDLARRFKEPEAVINGIEAHHGDVEFANLEAILVQAADAISAARPGARRETIETYIKRLEQLEEIATNFDGIEKSFAVQAGRELRIIVKPNEVDDAHMITTARKIAQEIESQLDFPGQIKVNVIRETRAIEYAK
ncbi:MAG: ribonuclease Y [Peptoniphilus sp.]|nr:ribonuclease Y [Peptoniphilus sp.]MDD7362993.1 ribonuclease Y [Bacillota bacterium]MDY6044233.1 ribonuclease Y [Peptoniphilus sp.]